MSQVCKKCRQHVYLGIGHTCPDTACYYHVPVTPTSPSRARPSALHAALCFLGELELSGNTKAGEIAMALRKEAPDARAGDCDAIPQDVRYALDRMCTPLDPSRLAGATADADARCMKVIRDYIDRLTTKATP